MHGTGVNERARRVDELNESIGSLAEDIAGWERRIKQWEDERGLIMQKRVDVAEARLKMSKLEREKDKLLAHEV